MENMDDNKEKLTAKFAKMGQNFFNLVYVFYAFALCDSNNTNQTQPVEKVPTWFWKGISFKERVKKIITGQLGVVSTIWLFSRMDLHVDSKHASLIARVVALWTNKRFFCELAYGF